MSAEIRIPKEKIRLKLVHVIRELEEARAIIQTPGDKGDVSRIIGKVRKTMANIEMMGR